MVRVAAGCTLCPRRCGADRAAGAGRCGGGSLPRVARAAPHHWEEPPISGTGGSGTVFFAGCGLGCAFCQNREISAPGYTGGRLLDEAGLAEVFLDLQSQGVHNLNLVTATHYRPWVLDALALAKKRGLALPVVWNTGGYETPEAIEELAGAVDVWLFDLKFHSPLLSGRLADAPDYFEVAAAALQKVAALAGPPVYDDAGLLCRGVVVRLLVLPGQRQDAKALLRWMADSLPVPRPLLSLMRQYTPPEGAALPKPFNRKLASFEYDEVCRTALELGFDTGWTQDKGSATSAFLPPFG